MLNNPISTIMETKVKTVNVDDTVEQIEKTLDQYKLSSVPVVYQEGKCFGILSNKDIVHFHITKNDPKTVSAWEICTHRVIEVKPNTTIREAAEVLVKNRIHHLIVTENEVITGIVSSIDFINKCLLVSALETVD